MTLKLLIATTVAVRLMEQLLLLEKSFWPRSQARPAALVCVRATRYCHQQNIGFEEQVLAAGARLFAGSLPAGRVALGLEGHYSSITWALHTCI